MNDRLSVALIVGGPSLGERGISLNSARSIADHLDGDDISLDRIIYYDSATKPYVIDRSLLYSNTPSDFDFKLSSSQSALDDDELAAMLTSVDLVFPAIHGEFGEDGQLQAMLERLGVPFVGSSSAACLRAFDKYDAVRFLESRGLGPVQSVLVRSKGPLSEEARTAIETLLAVHGAVVVKPCRGGSSNGVVVARSMPDVDAAIGASTGDVVVQPKILGKEFTVVVVDGPNGPVALPPLEIELRDGDIFSFEHKYLPSTSCTYHCPPRFGEPTTTAIRDLITAAYTALGLRDFARIDGWFCDDGIFVSDINPISGMEQNSFFFLQAAEIGLSHANALRYVVQSACRRHGLPIPQMLDNVDAEDDRHPVPIVFGGSTAERHVSVLSGTNVWLKLRKSDRYRPIPFLLRRNGSLWQIPYAAALRHTVEEIEAYCERGSNLEHEKLRQLVTDAMGLPTDVLAETSSPQAIELATLLANTSLIFLALHGGVGEDGTIQRQCEVAGVRFNGSGSVGSAVCMDKFVTGEMLSGLGAQGIHTAKRVRLDIDELSSPSTWPTLQEQLGRPPYCVKPVGDGCSAGVAPISTKAELECYASAVRNGALTLRKSLFAKHAADPKLEPTATIDMPTTKPAAILVEQWWEVDSVEVIDAEGSTPARLDWASRVDSGWIEITTGVLGKQGSMRALNPSVTIASNAVLSVQEKFMGGTGVNITPPPVDPLGRATTVAIEKARELVALVANQLGIAGYARIDAFMHRETGELVVIEANSLPGLSPSTVLYHQALAEDPPMYPRQLLEHILDLALDEG